MQRLYEEDGISGIIESAGTMDWNVGNTADARAISVARANGIDLTKHRARQITIEDFETFDLIFVMENVHAQSLRKLAPEIHRSKICLLGGSDEILDPYHSNEAAFHDTYRLLKQYCRRALRDHVR